MDYTIKYSGNCPIVDPSSGSAFSIEPALFFTEEGCNRGLDSLAGFTNAFNSSTSELQVPGEDAFPKPLESFHQRAQDTIKRIFAAEVAEIHAGDKFYIQTPGDAHDAIPLEKDEDTFFAKISSGELTLIAEVSAKETLALHNEDGTSSLFSRTAFQEAVKKYSEKKPVIEEDCTALNSAISHCANVIHLFPART